jgi:hypothetical protein
MKEAEDQKPYIPPFLRTLLPDANEHQLLQATENLRAYLVVAYGIFTRIESDESADDSRQSLANGRFIDKGADVPEL